MYLLKIFIIFVSNVVYTKAITMNVVICDSSTFKYHRHGGGQKKGNTKHHSVFTERSWLQKGDVLADGPATDRGQLALGAKVTRHAKKIG